MIFSEKELICCGESGIVLQLENRSVARGCLGMIID